MTTRNKKLIGWFARHQRVLPWRSEPTPYRVWISEIMLQQTQVVTVRPYFEKFIARFPTVETLAFAPEASVMQSWAGLGYYSRARNLHRAAQQIHASGRFPGTRAEWEALPGVGPYTAGAILSIAFGQPEAILDGNVERVLSRVHEESGKPTLWVRSREWMQATAEQKQNPSDLNQALMELGALVCTPKNPACPLCPLREGCGAALHATIEQYPPRKKPKAWVHRVEQVAWVQDAKDRVLLVPSTRWRKGLWDFPDEAELRARLTRAESGKLKRLRELKIKTVVTHHKIERRTEIFLVGETARQRMEKIYPEGQWLSVDALSDAAVGAAVRKTVKLFTSTRAASDLSSVLNSKSSSRA